MVFFKVVINFIQKDFKCQILLLIFMSVEKKFIKKIQTCKTFRTIKRLLNKVVGGSLKFLTLLSRKSRPLPIFTNKNTSGNGGIFLYYLLFIFIIYFNILIKNYIIFILYWKMSAGGKCKTNKAILTDRKLWSKQEPGLKGNFKEL